MSSHKPRGLAMSLPLALRKAEARPLCGWGQLPREGAVFIRFPALNSSTPATDWQLAVSRGYEIHIDDSGYNPATNTSGDPAHATGSIYAIQPPSPLASNPIGQWNAYRVRAQAAKVNVWLNGTHVITDFVVDLDAKQTLIRAPLRLPPGKLLSNSELLSPRPSRPLLTYP